MTAAVAPRYGPSLSAKSRNKNAGLSGTALLIWTEVIDKHGGFEYSASVRRSMHRSSDPRPDRSCPGAGYAVRLRSAGRDGPSTAVEEDLDQRKLQDLRKLGIECSRCRTFCLKGCSPGQRREMASGNSGKSKEKWIQWLGGYRRACRKVAENGLKFTSEVTTVHGPPAKPKGGCARPAQSGVQPSKPRVTSRLSAPSPRDCQDRCWQCFRRRRHWIEPQ
jgi:hypothetical protein